MLETQHTPDTWPHPQTMLEVQVTHTHSLTPHMDINISLWILHGRCSAYCSYHFMYISTMFSLSKYMLNPASLFWVNNHWAVSLSGNWTLNRWCECLLIKCLILYLSVHFLSEHSPVTTRVSIDPSNNSALIFSSGCSVRIILRVFLFNWGMRFNGACVSNCPLNT